MRYFDTSALVKQYLQEAGSKSYWSFCERARRYIRRVSPTETYAAFSRQTREGRLTRDTSRRLALRFDKDWESYDIVILSETVLRLARQLLDRHPLRSADAIHLARRCSLLAPVQLLVVHLSALTAVSARPPKN